MAAAPVGSADTRVCTVCEKGAHVASFPGLELCDELACLKFVHQTTCGIGQDSTAFMGGAQDLGQEFSSCYCSEACARSAAQRARKHADKPSTPCLDSEAP